MLVQSVLVKNPSVERLITAWARIYTPNLRMFANPSASFHLDDLLKTTPEGREVTARKLDDRLVELRCQVASIQTSTLYTYIENVMHLYEIKRVAEASFAVYKRLIELYQQDALGLASINYQQLTSASSAIHPTGNNCSNITIEQLANGLEPVLLEFQEEHTRSKDWRALGFMTTQLNFCNQWLMQKLTLPEQVLMAPYLKFVEEQSAHPWQRVCVAASAYSFDHPVLLLAERIIPQCEEIAEAAYHRIVQLLPYHISRRGALTNAEIAHSCIRDFKMFQGYLWLCVLEKSLNSIEHELLDLCIRVLPSVGVKWELSKIWTQVLADELLIRIEPAQQPYILPYTAGMQQIFLNARSQLDTPLSRKVVK